MVSDSDYTTVAKDHARHPRNLGPLDPCSGHARLTGPCGRIMEFWINIRGGRIQRASFNTDGTDSSRACGSMATVLARDVTVEEAFGIEQKDILFALGGFPEDDEHCALLAASALHAACQDFIHKATKR
jgi:NifU-like protein involved in Fe-S cluster formation